MSILLLLILFNLGYLFGQSIRIDHHHTQIDQIPDSVFTSIKSSFNMIHGHLSHGWQIDDGLDSLHLTYDDLNVEIGNYELPHSNNSLNIMYYYAEYTDFWYAAGSQTLKGYLKKYPTINVVLFSWCRDLDTADNGFVQAYLDTFQTLESDFPDKYFIYSTGNAQKSGLEGYTRHTNNEFIRNYCETNDKILYDFADLDCWWYNADAGLWEDASYVYNETVVPVEHMMFHQELWHHTTVESGIQKAKALWWLLARLEGWSGNSSLTIPVAVNDSVSFSEDHNVNIDLLGNDYCEGNKIKVESVEIAKMPVHGEIKQIDKSTGFVLYEPFENYYGSDSFKYTVKNQLDEISNIATVHINITPVNDPPGSFNLIQPADEDSIYLVNSIVEFKWYSSKDTDSPELEYTLYLKHGELDTAVSGITDTVFNFSDPSIWVEHTEYSWNVIAWDGILSVTSDDTFRFKFKNINDINLKMGAIPGTDDIYQNYPNPFNATCRINYQISVQNHVRIDVLNSAGQIVQNLVNEIKYPGYHALSFNAGQLASGIYFYAFYINGKKYNIRKMILIK